MALRETIVATVVTSVAVVSLVPGAVAHEPRRFRACTVHLPGSCVGRGAAFIHGDRVAIRGKAEPPTLATSPGCSVRIPAPRSGSWWAP
jgi:hypothetical protein